MRVILLYSSTRYMCLEMSITYVASIMIQVEGLMTLILIENKFYSTSSAKN